MQQLFQSGFLLGLGKAITSSIWQTGLLFLAYHLLVFVCKIKQARHKNFISSLFALTGFVWFFATVFFFWNKPAATTLVIESGLNSNDLSNTFSNTGFLQLLFSWAEYKLNFILPYLSVAYLFVLVWFCTKLIYQFNATNTLRVKGVVSVDKELQSYFIFLSRSLGISKKAALFFTNRIDIPATFGFFKPIVLLPAAAVTHLTPEQLEAVLLHELAHIKRNDYFWNLLLSISETILFFNPFAQLLITIARKERELSCDDVVISYQQNAAVYAEALLNVELARQHAPQFAMALGDNKHHLKLRVKRILNLPAEKNKISARLLALLFLTFVFALTGWVVQQKNITKDAGASVSNSITKNKEVFFISPSALLTKDQKTVSLRDEKRNVKLQLNNEEKKAKFTIWTEEGESASFEKLIVNGVPEEWIHELIQPGNPTPSLPVTRQRMPQFHFQSDSLAYLHETIKMKELALWQLYITQQNRYSRDAPAYQRRELPWPPGYYFDSIFVKNNMPQNVDVFKWH